MSDLRGQKVFAFYGRTRTPMRARSPEAVQERTRQLSLASSLIETVHGKIALAFFDTASVPLSALRHRANGRDLLKAVTGPVRSFDAVVIGDTRATLSPDNSTNLPCFVQLTTSICGVRRSAAHTPTTMPATPT